MSNVEGVKIVDLEIEQVDNVLNEVIKELQLLLIIPQKIGFDLSDLPQSFQKLLVKQRQYEEEFMVNSHKKDIEKKHIMIEKIKKNTRRVMFILDEYRDLHRLLLHRTSNQPEKHSDFKEKKDVRKDYGEYFSYLKDFCEIYKTQIHRSHEINKLNKQENEKHLENYKRSLSDIVAINRMIKQKRFSYDSEIEGLESRIFQLQQKYDKELSLNPLNMLEEQYDEEDKLATQRYLKEVHFRSGRNMKLQKEIQRYRKLNKVNEKNLEIARRNVEKRINVSIRKRDKNISRNVDNINEKKEEFVENRVEIHKLNESIGNLTLDRESYSRDKRMRLEKMKKNLLLIQSVGHCNTILKRILRNKKHRDKRKQFRKKIKKRRKKRDRSQRFERLYQS